MQTENSSDVAEAAIVASTRRTWVAPAVLDLGGMRQLTLLQGASINGGCDLTDPAPNCGF